MTRVRAQGAERTAGADQRAGTANNYASCSSSRTTPTSSAARSTCSVSPRLSLFGRYGYRDVDIVDQPPIPLPSGGGGNGVIYVTQQAARGRRDLHADATARCSSSASAGRTPTAEKTRWRSDAEQRSKPTASPACRPTRASRAACRRRSITGYSAISAARRPIRSGSIRQSATRRSTTRGCAAGTRSRPATSSSTSRPKCRTSTRSTAATQYAGQFTRPAGAAANNLYNLADFMLGLRSTYRAQQHPRRQPAPEHALPLPAGRLPRQRQADAEPRPALRIRDAVLGAGQHPVELRSGDAQMVLARTARSRIARRIKPDRNNFGPRLGLAYTVTPSTVIRGGYGISYVHFHRAGGANVLPINGPQVINAVVVADQPAGRRRSGATEQGYPGGPHRSVALQSARREHHLHAARLPLQPRAELVRVGAARALARTSSSTSPTSAIAPTACCCSRTSIRRRRTTRGHDPAAGAAADSGVRRHHLCVQRRQVAVPRASRRSSTGACAADLSLLSSLTLSQTKDNGAGSLENPNGNFPAPQDFYNLDADYGLSGYHQPYNSTTSFVLELPFGRGRVSVGRLAAGSTRSSAAGRSPPSTSSPPASR